MKRILSLILTFSLVLTLGGCSSRNTASEPRKEVEIHLPENNTVNGYREESASKEQVSSSASQTPSTENVQYCANINSKVFHLKSCSSVTNMKEENKYLLSNREALINDGYTPCGRCKP